MPAALDLTGERFGYLTAIRKAPSQKGKTYWLCRCDCGEEKEIQTSHLRNGAIQSCGCQKRNQDSVFQGEIKVCEICGESFETIKFGGKRRFCFKCSPPKFSISSIRRAIKKQLVKEKGGECEICGYNKSLRALEFHHTNPSQKDFAISRQLELKDFKMDIYRKEIDKCILLCSNCHAEQHDSDLNGTVAETD